MSLEDKLAQPATWPSASRRGRPKHPDGWEPGIDTRKGEITAMTDTAEGPDWSHVLRNLGLDPDDWRVVGDVAEIRSWDQAPGARCYYHKAKVSPAREMADLDMEELAARVRSRGPLRAAKSDPAVATGAWLVVVLSDWQCLAPDTMILDRETGRIMRLDDHPDAWRTGDKETVTVKVWGGYEVSGSLDHPVMTRGGWKHLGDLTSTDEVAVVDGWTRWGDESLPDDVAEFVGLMTSDGSGYREGVQSAKFTNCDPELIEFVDGVASGLGSNTKRYEKGSGWDITLTTAEGGESVVQKLMRDLELDDNDFPTAITGMSRSTQARFLAGLFAGDGCLTTRGSRRQVSVELACGNSRQFAVTVQMMLHRFGVRSLIRSEVMHKASDGAEFHRLVLSSSDVARFMEEIGPIRGKELPEGVHLPSSRRYISRECHEGPDGEVLRWARVRKVEPSGMSEVWDITVPDKHWFVAGGVQAHNCGKGTGGGASQLVDRIERIGAEVEQRLTWLRDGGVPISGIAIVICGDMVEGCDGYYPMQTFSIDLDDRQQTKLVRRLLLELVDRWATLAEKIVVTVAPGNHGEKRKGTKGGAFTAWSDNTDAEIVEQLSEITAANPDRYGHVSYLMPEHDQLTVTLELDGLIVGAAHGHQCKTGGSVPKRVWTWWEKMAATRHPIGDADVLVTGHYHHLAMRSDGTHDGGTKTWLQAPALDGGSPWWEMGGGSATAAGTLTFVAHNAMWSHLHVIPADLPPVAAQAEPEGA